MSTAPFTLIRSESYAYQINLPGITILMHIIALFFSVSDPDPVGFGYFDVEVLLKI